MQAGPLSRLKIGFDTTMTDTLRRRCRGILQWAFALTTVAFVGNGGCLDMTGLSAFVVAYTGTVIALALANYRVNP